MTMKIGTRIRIEVAITGIGEKIKLLCNRTIYTLQLLRRKG